MGQKQPRAPRVRVKVTEELITNSVKRDSSHCMIADAIRSAYPDAARVSVDIQTVRFTDPKKGLRFTYLTPRIGQVALVQFDQGNEPTPFDFELRGGQVTASGARGKRFGEEKKPRSEAQKRASAKARLVRRDGSGSKPGNVPDKVGGKPPPLGSFARRREFGLRSLTR